MRKPIIAGNWKMNKTISEARNSFVESDERVNSIQLQQSGCSCLLHQLLFLRTLVKSQLRERIYKSVLKQCTIEKNGAFTGEISPVALAT